jgi:MerR family redox-sensitive transcriptional activator SoxR
MDQTTLTIGQLARRFGLKTSAIRYYERVGVLPEPKRHSGQRRYGADAIRRLEVLDVAERAAFSLDEVRVLLHGADAGTPAFESLRDLAASNCQRWSRSSHARKRCASGC